MPPLSGVPAFRYQQSFSRCITCQDVCLRQSHVVKRLRSQLEVIIRRFAATLLLRNKE